MARWLDDEQFTAAEWWRGLCVTAYMTGWRSVRCWRSVGSMLTWKSEATRWPPDNKGKRDQKIPLHPVVIEHLRKLQSFSLLVFPWGHARRGLYEEFHAIQKRLKFSSLAPSRSTASTTCVGHSQP